ncbi:MAG: YdeI/OmpD-associated family protein [Bacteroidetes bacterium]|nr:YdeI/OmpD-associated family protein [Bacteroidota bacterium]
MNPKVHFYFEKEKRWTDEIIRLREIVLQTQVNEELKWGCPCYVSEGKNIVLIHTFKNYCALLFFNGALLPDPKGLLVQQTPNVQAARQMRFTHLSEIIERESDIRSFIKKAITAEKNGEKVVLKKTTDFIMADEFAVQLKANPKLKKAFDALTPGRQRAYLMHFSSARQAKTRVERVEKCIPKILSGKGLDD